MSAKLAVSVKHRSEPKAVCAIGTNLSLSLYEQFGKRIVMTTLDEYIYIYDVLVLQNI